MTEHTPQEHRPRGSFVAAAAALSRLGRLRDLPVILTLAWVGWLAIPWPSSGLTQARGLTTGVQDMDAPAAPAVRPAAAGTAWTLAAAPAAPPPTLVKPPPPVPPSAEEPCVGEAEEPGAGKPGAEGDLARLIAGERARIAGEVHDAAGHGLATIAMQAGLALLMFDEHPDQVRESLEAIRATSTRALGQLRSALDLVESGPSGHDLSELFAGVRAAGLAVTVEPARPYVPPQLEDVVYRVVRESLTNVLRHAGPTQAAVRIAHDRDGLRVEVLDRGSGTAGTPAGTAGTPVEGRGLTGMRARVVRAGGSFEAGPREDGGFHVTAHFPPGTASAKTDFPVKANTSRADFPSEADLLSATGLSSEAGLPSGVGLSPEGDLPSVTGLPPRVV
ncbi:histidine kinase [Streptosporangium sp. NPDC020145]|uniref:sensor histidine kinase n=1 Tax=Streptosporangium sp. NPDC020145 TaxID=3154694 RepID=UPI00343C42FC